VEVEVTTLNHLWAGFADYPLFDVDLLRYPVLGGHRQTPPISVREESVHFSGMRAKSMDQHFLNSSFREKLIEHLLIGELLKISWNKGSCSLEVAKPEVDNQNYDIIAEENGVIRHIQLKAAKLGATTPSQKIHTALANKPSGCVLWVYFDEKLSHRDSLASATGQVPFLRIPFQQPLPLEISADARR
jgi:hypothetical protein